MRILRDRVPRVGGALLAGLLSVAGASSSGDAVSQCSWEQTDKWLRLRRASLGVTATDEHPILDPSVRPSPGQPPAEACPSVVDFSKEQDGRANDGVHSWVFAHPCKVTACGRLRSFEPYWYLHWLTGEYDLNHNIEIGPPSSEEPSSSVCKTSLTEAEPGPGQFRWEMLARHLCFPEGGRDGPNVAPQEPRLCFPGTDELHVEVTPPPRLRPLLRHLWLEDSSWGWVRWRASLHEETLCVYGPFVGDTAHGAKAEIHPGQLYWWNERASGGCRKEYASDGPYALFLIQDASGRYYSEHGFVLRRKPPGSWAPWAGGNLTGTFSIPFWVGRAQDDRLDAPLFTVAPYEHDGVATGSPGLRACPEPRPTLEVTGPNSEPERVATLCNRALTRGRDVVSLEGTVLCGLPPEEGHREPSGYLGMLTVRVQSGSGLEWGEGHLGLLLTDSRSPDRREPSAESPLAAAEPQRPGVVTPMVTWKPTPGHPWVMVDPAGPDEIRRAVATVNGLFDKAHWPSEARPLTSLWRLDSVDLTVDVAVQNVPERYRDSLTAIASFDTRTPPLAHPLEGGAAQGVRLVELGQRGARLDLASLDPLSAWYLELPVQVRAEYGDSEGKRRRCDSPESTWEIWTHGLGTNTPGDWHRAAARLCRHEAAEQPRSTSARSVHVAPADDLRIIVEKAIRDGVVSMAELHLMKQEIRQVCRPDGSFAGPRPVRAMAQ